MSEQMVNYYAVLPARTRRAEGIFENLALSLQHSAVSPRKALRPSADRTV